MIEGGLVLKEIEKGRRRKSNKKGCKKPIFFKSTLFSLNPNRIVKEEELLIRLGFLVPGPVPPSDLELIR